MGDDYSYDGSDSGIMLPGLLASEGCAVCSERTPSLRCGKCRVVNYCGTTHQSAHQSKHKATCSAIKRSRDAVEREETALRAQDSLADIFNSGVGRFGDIPEARDYMRARLGAAIALLRVNTARAVEDALGHLKDMLWLCRSDNLGVRDIIPHLLLRLGREQECYEFLKWWAIIDDEFHYDWDTCLDIRDADVFEPINIFCSGAPNLSHLVALTLLKLRLHLDLEAFTESAGRSALHDPHLSRSLGRLAREKLRIMDLRETSMATKILKQQYRRLCRAVNDANPYFWDALITEETSSPPPFFSRGSKEEADLVFYQCQRAWQETEDAISMVDVDTWIFTRVYEGTTSTASVSNTPPGNLSRELVKLERDGGSGNVFPSRFEPPLSTSSPAELFPPTPIGRNQTIRFVCHNDQRKVMAYVDGACANNGQLAPRAGWAVAFGTPKNGNKSNRSVVSGRLEDKGPFGDVRVATSNRAELRAAIAALRLCDWRAEGYNALVVAADSSYVIDGATRWAKGWVRNGWKTRTGSDAKNRDLWGLLLGEVGRWKGKGLRVDLWKIPRELNVAADAAAKQAARDGAAEAEFKDITIDSSQTMAIGTKQGHRILALCLEGESLFDACFGSLVSHIALRAKIERATTQEAALAILNQKSCPSVILVADGAITRQRKIWERVIDRLREGATVVLCGLFSGMVSTGEFNRLFARVGLPWQRGSYDRKTVSLRYGVVGNHLASCLPSSYSQKGLFVRNTERSAAWYAESETSNEAAVAFTEVGSGKLGYVGDVNGEESSDLVVLAMCGLLR